MKQFLAGQGGSEGSSCSLPIAKIVSGVALHSPIRSTIVSILETHYRAAVSFRPVSDRSRNRTLLRALVYICWRSEYQPKTDRRLREGTRLSAQAPGRAARQNLPTLLAIPVPCVFILAYLMGTGWRCSSTRESRDRGPSSLEPLARERTRPGGVGPITSCPASSRGWRAGFPCTPA
jgi:hypothetical protein